MQQPRPRRALIAVITTLTAAAFAAPLVIPAPDLREGRALASAPALPGSLADLADLRQRADDYVADRFPARPHLIGLLNLARLKLGDSGSDRVLIGRDGWLFYNDGSLLGPARGEPAISDAQSAQWLTALSGRIEAVAATGATYLVIAPPAKETVYPHKGPRWYKGPNPDRPSAVLARLAERVAPGHVLTLDKALVAETASGVETFTPNDTHWTGDGAYAGYRAIMQQLRAAGLDQPDQPLSGFRLADNPRPPRDLALMLGVASFIPIHFPDYVDPAAKSWKTTWLSARRGWTAPQVVATGRPDRPTLLMTRDSFSNALTPFLLGHFGRVILTHIDDGTWRPDLIDRFAPDFVILEVQENGLSAVMQPAPAASPDAIARIAAILPGVVFPGGAFAAVGATEQAALAAAKPAPACFLDTATIEGSTLRAAGWITDFSSGAGLPEAVIRLSSSAGDWSRLVIIDQQRPDVAEANKRTIGGPAGFQADLDATPLSAGPYALRLYRRTPAGWIVCEGPQITVR